MYSFKLHVLLFVEKSIVSKNSIFHLVHPFTIFILEIADNQADKHCNKYAKKNEIY